MVNGDLDYQNWKVSQATFQGYMKAKMEDISSKLDDVSNHNKDQDTKIGKIENELTSVKVKSSIFGTIGGLIGGFLGGLIK